MLAFDSSPARFQAALRAPEERLGQYTLLKKLPAGLRAEVWLGLPPGAASLGQLVAIKAFFPPVEGAARAALATELALASRLTHSNLSHANIVQTLRVGHGAASGVERPFIVSEYVEGTTLQALLRRVSVARARVATSVVTRLLLGIVRAVCHAERKAASLTGRLLVRQMVAADDVFVSFDGAVKLLGFKARLERAEPIPADVEPRPAAASWPAAIDALLSQHLTPALSAVLAAACEAPAGGIHALGGVQGIRRVEQGLERWQADVVGSDGRAELAALMGAMFPTARLEQRAWLEARLEQWLSASSIGMPLASDADDGAPPASGFRTIVA